jgi:hypothetical protein
MEWSYAKIQALVWYEMDVWQNKKLEVKAELVCVSYCIMLFLMMNMYVCMYVYTRDASWLVCRLACCVDI